MPNQALIPVTSLQHTDEGWLALTRRDHATGV
jgi:hypothetical protein